MVVHVRGAHTETHVADANVVAIDTEQLPQQVRPFRRIHMHDQLRAAASQGKAETVHRLIGLRVINVDDLICRGSTGKWQRRRLQLEQSGSIGIRQPKRNIVLRMGCQGRQHGNEK